MAETYKILIADDEYWTREKFRSMINWSEYSLEFLEPAADGEEVLRRIEQEHPHILITDINMPFMNGAELLHVIEEKYPDIVTFVVSGYNDFEYVKDTLLSGAINYLIKPVSRLDLIRVLSKALELISEKENQEAEEEKKNSELLKAASLIQDREFSQLIRKEEAFTSSITMNRQVEFTGTRLMLIKIHNMKSVSPAYHYDINLLSYHLKKEFRRRMRNEDITVFNHIYRPNEFLIVSELDSEELRKGAERILLYMANISEAPVTICISGHAYTMERLNTAYTQTVALLMTRLFHKKSQIVCCENGDESVSRQNYIQGYFKEEYEKQMVSLLQSGNKKALYDLITDKIGLKHCEEHKWTYLQVKQTTRRILSICIEFASEHPGAAVIADVENMAEMAENTIELLDAEELCNNISGVLDLVMVQKQENTTDSIQEMAGRAARYIEEHYYENLTLSSLAEKYNVESSYFSKVFRQVTGENLMMYITTRRINKAMELMSDKGISLTEIAYMVGYDDYAYFSRVFKKIKQQSPREYRNKIEKNTEKA